jgi:hypothetical protein
MFAGAPYCVSRRPARRARASCSACPGLRPGALQQKDGKVVGHVHRVVSADGKTLTVHNTGAQLSGATGDDTLVFDRR